MKPEAFAETTNWGPNIQNHIYLLSGNMALAYLQSGCSEPKYFKKPFQISKTGRKFVKVTPNPFKVVEEKDPDIIEVLGSKGNTYYINTREKTCTCSGYTFRGTCKHLKGVN